MDAIPAEFVGLNVMRPSQNVADALTRAANVTVLQKIDSQSSSIDSNPKLLTYAPSMLNQLSISLLKQMKLEHLNSTFSA
jgi:hypothetical protein